jgi:hypothetical protein
MRFNLKNRPRFPIVDDWFEGFEKELRELSKTWKAHGNYNLIKEILGE